MSFISVVVPAFYTQETKFEDVKKLCVENFRKNAEDLVIESIGKEFFVKFKKCCFNMNMIENLIEENHRMKVKLQKSVENMKHLHEIISELKEEIEQMEIAKEEEKKKNTVITNSANASGAPMKLNIPKLNLNLVANPKVTNLNHNLNDLVNVGLATDRSSANPKLVELEKKYATTMDENKNLRQLLENQIKDSEGFKNNAARTLNSLIQEFEFIVTELDLKKSERKERQTKVEKIEKTRERPASTANTTLNNNANQIPIKALDFSNLVNVELAKVKNDTRISNVYSNVNMPALGNNTQNNFNKMKLKLPPKSGIKKY